MLKLLLLIIMVIEPVLFFYAMAGSHDESSVSMSQNMNASTHYSHTGDSKGKMNNCCSTPACGAAVFSSFSPPATEALFQYFAPFNLTWKGVILPTAIKPPRSLRG